MLQRLFRAALLLSCITSVVHPQSQFVSAGEPRILVHEDTTKTVSVSPIVHNNIDFLYFAVAIKAGMEAVFCMMGTADTVAKKFFISEVSIAWVDSASHFAMMYKPSRCTRPDVIGTMHFHPTNSACELSAADLETANGLAWPVTAIVCVRRGSSTPTIVLLHREEFRAKWEKVLSSSGGLAPFGFVPIYRYVPPDKRP